MLYLTGSLTNVGLANERMAGPQALEASLSISTALQSSAHNPMLSFLTVVLGIQHRSSFLKSKHFTELPPRVLFSGILLCSSLPDPGVSLGSSKTDSSQDLPPIQLIW